MATLTGTAGNDVLIGGTVDDILTGGSSDVQIEGGAGNGNDTAMAVMLLPGSKPSVSMTRQRR